MTAANVIPFPCSRISCREQAVRHVRLNVIAALKGRDPYTNLPWPAWRIGDLEIALCRPNEGLSTGLWTLDIWTPKQKVLNVSWSPNGDHDLEIISFRRGDWENQLLQFVGLSS